ncbi:MAG TPA: ankyrin repeat domain-containing protein [Gammaproteobacteria bacterium]|jgi:ankyrin repeat protein|nr:ankyrin repeat domain-containing protein [Gammaproteobacteria bacterium]
MTRSIGPHSRLDSLKREAKQWLKAVKARDATALARLRAALPEHEGAVTLRTAQWALAREHGLPGWQALLDALGASARERELREVADEMLRHAIFKGGEPAIAARLYARHPDVATLDLFCAVAAGNLEEVERRLAADPSAAARAGGPLDWPPLLYLAYLRWPGGARLSVEVARALLDGGADPNASWNDGWDNPFKVLTGVIGLGEGVQPSHERADALAELLLERGADPFDTQSLYDTSIVNDDTRWLEVLWAHSERRGVTDKWRTVLVGDKMRVSWLDLILSIAVSYNHPRRAEWALEHGAKPDGEHAYSKRRQHDEALLHRNDSMAALLRRYGAVDAPVDDEVAFGIACRALDRDEIRRLAASHPEYLRDPEVMLTAARSGIRDLVELLLDLGMDVDIADAGGIRALNHAAGAGAVDVVQLLLERGADVDRPTKHYGGPLGFAAHFGRRAVADVLAPRSRDVHNLVFLGMKERLRELFAAEPALANLEHFRSGLTPLFTLPPQEPDALEMARFLIEHGADVRFRGRNGDTPADAARKRGFESLAALLRAPRR